MIVDPNLPLAIVSNPGRLPPQPDLTSPRPIVGVFGHARSGNRAVVREGTFHVERVTRALVLVDPLCPCKRDATNGVATMCFACSGPQYIFAIDCTDGDL